MLEEEHWEICQADKEEQEFVLKCRKLLEEGTKEHPIRLRMTHQLIFDEKEKTYKPVRIPQYERGD